jgi:hypothetical protein
LSPFTAKALQHDEADIARLVDNFAAFARAVSS